ncbi:MAG: hypothetical protein LBQ87_05835 [Candidatus Fibromonas sp.]|nr:hypothetical protein [Candidatus Fibromonas sp.]
MIRILLLCILIFSRAFAVPPPDLPGVEVTDSEIALEQSKRLVQKQNQETVDIYENKGWTAPGLEEQLNQDETFIGMGQGAIFIPRFTESRLEPDYKAIKTDSLSKEDMGKEWTGKPGSRLPVPYGDYTVIIGSGTEDKKLEYRVRVDEGKTTLISPNWGGLVVNTMNEDGEFISESYEIFAVSNGESYGKGFGLSQERLNDVTTWILPPQLYRISRNGENASSILNYITVQVNPGELNHVELVFEESTGRLIAGGVHKMRISTSRNSHWTYGLRLGGSASYTTLVTADERKRDAWNALGDVRLRVIYNHPKVFWLTELYTRQNMQWLNEEQKESQWSVAQDLLQLQSSIVYRFFEWIGPYTRANVKTNIFPEYYYADTTIRRAIRKDTMSFSEEKIRISSSFDPLRIGEGVGLNLRPIISNSVDISAQTGFAARQIIRRNLLVPANNAKTIFIMVTDNVYEYGWENSLNIRFSFLRFFTLDLIGEVFFPNAKVSDYRIDELSADLRIAITRFLELSYQQQFYDRMTTEGEEAKGNRFESLNTVQLRLYVNF